MDNSLSTRKSLGGQLQLLIIALCSICPIVIILGNVLPPIGPYKLHWFYNGGIFFLNVLLLVLLIKKWVFPAFLFLVYLCLNIYFSIEFRFVELVNILAGPIVFLSVIISLEQGLIKLGQIEIFFKLFLIASFVPVTIALLQYIGLLPMTILNFTYVNVTKVNGALVERVNGYLFHGSELANIGYLLFAISAILVKRKYLFLLFLFFLLFQLVVLIRTSILGTICLFIYLMIATIKFEKRLKLQLLLVILGFGLGFILFNSDFLTIFFQKTLLSSKAEMLFNPDIFTGRGRMWTIFLFSIGIHYDTINYIFGGGFGVSKYLFEYGISFSNVKWPYEYIPHAHNEFLNTFINGGIVLIGIYVLLFWKANSILQRTNKTHYRLLPILMIILMTSGITIPIFDRFIFWVGLSFLIFSIIIKSGKMKTQSCYFFKVEESQKK